MNDYQAHLEDALSKIKFDKEQDLPHVEQYDIDNEVRTA